MNYLRQKSAACTSIDPLRMCTLPQSRLQVLAQTPCVGRSLKGARHRPTV